MRHAVPLLLGACALIATSTGALAEALFLSTQLRPIEEAQQVRNEILSGYDGQVEFIPEEPGRMVTRMRAEQQAGEGSVTVLGAVHGELPPVMDGLQPVDDVLARLQDRGLLPTFVELGKLGTDQQIYIPWMQATYIMAANVKALEYLPEGADPNRLTYAQIAEWGKNIMDATGERKLGFPAGPDGLMHRFFQGYLYPAYTGGVVRSFKSPEAEAMWTEFRDLWQYVSPRSTAYAFMQEPLLADEVWVAFDHTARLLDALNQKPEEFVAFPAPAGPAGRGFMPVVAGLAIPATSPDPAEAAALIDYLTSPEAQLATMRTVGFFPVIEMEAPDDLQAGIKMAAGAIALQAQAADAVPSLLPVGLGDLGDQFSKLYTDTFQLIVLRGGDIRATLDSQGEKLAALMAEAGAPCWAPDADSGSEPCPVE